jgi:hypothetical protein
MIHKRIVILEGSKEWIEATLKISLKEGKNQIGPGATITIKTVEIITTKNGLLYQNGKEVGLPMADKIANEYGYVYIERFVNVLELQK